MSNKQSFLAAASDWFDKFFGGSQVNKGSEVEVTKALDDEQRMALFVVLEPDAVDLHQDTYTAVEVEKACNNFNTFCNKANLFHKAQIEDAKIVQSYISPASFTLDDGREIKKGTWLQWWYFPETETGDLLWQGVKDGTINGVSIGALATVEELNG